MAWAGAMGKSMGAQAASAKAAPRERSQPRARVEERGGRLTDYPSERLETELIDLLLRSKHERTGSIVKGRSVGSSDGAILLEHGAKRGDLVELDLLELLILDDDDVSLALVGDGDRGDLGLEGFGCPGGGGLLVRGDGVGVLLLAGDVEVLGRLLAAVGAQS